MQRKYKARATVWGLGETETGKEQVAVECIILTEGADIERITYFGYFTEAAWERTIESLRHFGWTGNDLSQLDGLDANEVELVIEDEEYKGKFSPKVKWVNRLGGLALKAPLSGDRLKSFAASMRAQIQIHDASAGQRKPAAAKPRPIPAATPVGGPDGPPPHSDDDIPF